MTLAAAEVEQPARDKGLSASFPGFDALNGTDRTALLGASLPETVWFYDVDRGKNVVRTRSQDGKLGWEVPLAPFLGCLGVAPANGEARSTIVPDGFGGNMDCPEVKAGNTVYLGVRVPGALVSFGDGHYAMGDGEIIGTAVEGAMDVELTVDLIPNRETPWPRIESDEEIMSPPFRDWLWRAPSGGIELTNEEARALRSRWKEHLRSIGFRNRFLVITQWAWAYVTYQRGARLITGDTQSR